MTGSFVRAAATALAFVVVAQSAPAAADVLSISEDGLVTAYRAPMVHTDAGAVALGQARAPAAAPIAPVTSVQRLIAEAAGRYGLSASLLEAVAWQESRLQHRAVSPKGAVGVMQLMPATARELGVDPSDVAQNVQGGAAYLAQMLRRYRGDLKLALAAYNAGPGAVDRHAGVPPYAETQAYVGAILARLAQPTR